MRHVPLLQTLSSDDIVVILSAHCDDAAIGCGGFLRRLKRQSDCTVVSLVFSGGDNHVREQEERQAASALGVDETQIWSYPDSLLPNHWHEIKSDLLSFRQRVGEERVTMLLCPSLQDRHQDHRVVAENAWRVFRDHVILEYEIHKYEADLVCPNLYVELQEEDARCKVDVLMREYSSRRCHGWWSEEAFLSLMRIRGLEANVALAEAFCVRKVLV